MPLRIRASSGLFAFVSCASLVACGSDDDTGLGLGSAAAGMAGANASGAGGRAVDVAGAGGASPGGTGGMQATGGTGGSLAEGGSSGSPGGAGTGGSLGKAGTAGAAGSPGKGGTGGAATGELPGDVPATCAAAAEARGTLGCSFRAVDLPNEPTSPSGGGAAKEPWGVLIGNPGASEAEVRLVRLDQAGNEEVVSVEKIAPSSAREVSLPSYEVNGVEAGEVGGSARSKRSMRITSDLPVGVVQLNTLAPTGSSDGTVLFPESALGSSYIVAGWPAANGYLPQISLPGLPDHAYLTIVGGDEPVELTVTPTFAIAAAPDVAGAPAKTTVTYTLAPWEVLHLATAALPLPKGPFEYVELTGTTIEASAPVAVFSGNERATVANVAGLPQPPGADPTGTCCTDHFEEQLVPSNGLGTRFVIAKSPLRSTGGFVEGDLVRFVGGPEQTIVQTSNPAFPSFVLGKGQVVDMALVTDLVVEAKKGIIVAQLLASKDETNGTLGDPSFTLVPPETAFLRRQAVVLPTQSWAQKYVSLVAEEGTTFTADGVAMAGCLVRPSFGLPDDPKRYVAQVCPLLDSKLVEGSAPFGATAYGYDQTTSFAYAVTSGLGVSGL